MLKLKPLLSSIYPKIYENSIKLYSETAKNLEPAIILPEPLNAQELRTTLNTDSEMLKDGSPQTWMVGKSSEVDGKQDGSNDEGRDIKKCFLPKTIQPRDPGPPGGYIMDKCDVFDIPKANSKKWRTISYVALPFVLGLSLFMIATKEEYPKREFIPYEHLYRRTKRFAWRDGKTSLFHGPNNLIPEEEEKRLDSEGATQPRYKTEIDEEAEKIKRRDQHALEELEKRKKRHQEEESHQKEESHQEDESRQKEESHQGEESHQKEESHQEV